MRWKTTWLLFGLAAVLFAFIMLVERRSWRPTSSGGEPLPRLVTFKATEVTNVQLRITNQLALRVERPNAASLWRLIAPFQYPGHLHKIERVCRNSNKPPPGLHPPTNSAPTNAPSPSSASICRKPPSSSAQRPAHRDRFGSKTPTGDSVYAQLASRPGIFIVGADVFNQLPRSANDWRDTALFNLIGIAWNRIEFRAGSRSSPSMWTPRTRFSSSATHQGPGRCRPVRAAAAHSWAPR
jgi:hypothetical protein